MIVNTRSFRSYAEFGALPENVAGYLNDAVPGNPGETKALMDNDDGLKKVWNFNGRWAQAVSLSKETDAVRSDPAASALNSIEASLASRLLSGLTAARNNYPWGNTWGRTKSRQKALTEALAEIGNALDAYNEQVAGHLNQVKAQIVDRAAAEAVTRRKAEEAKAQQAEAQRKQAEAEAAEAEKRRSEAAAKAATAAKQEVKAGIELKKLVEFEKAPKLFGVPLSILGGVAVLLGGAVTTVVLLKRRRLRLRGA